MGRIGRANKPEDIDQTERARRYNRPDRTGQTEQLETYSYILVWMEKNRRKESRTGGKIINTDRINMKSGKLEVTGHALVGQTK